MRQVHALAVAIAATAALAGSARAAAPRPLAIAVDATPEVEPWRADALRRLLAIEAGEDHRLEVIDDDTPAELTLAGTITADHMDLRLDGGNRATAARIPITGTDRTHVRRALRAMLDRGLRPAGEDQLVGGPAQVAAADAGVPALLAVWLAILVVLALPLGFGVWLLGAGGLAQVMKTRALRYAAAIAAAALVALLGIAAGADALTHAGPTLYIAGGLAWGWFAVSTLRVVFPAFPGFERVEHGDVFRLTRAWSMVALQRLVRTTFYYLPFAAVLWLACWLLEVPATVAVALVVPVWGLVARFWLLAAVDLAALYLDTRLVRGDATDANPWSPVMRGYFMGYVRRAGWPADDHLLENIRFLPGESDDVVVSYGGGLTHARVIVGQATLESALAPYGRPHDYAGPRISKLHWSEWNAGLVVPVEIKGTIATPEQRQPMYATVPGETDWEPLGEPPTLAGVIEPEQFDKRDHHRPHEDPLWLDWDPGDEHDGTDASDKDFVFGALVHELGSIRRGDAIMTALGLALRTRLAAGPAWARAVVDRVGGWIDRGLSRYPAIVGDAYAALNFARHHLMQYLAWREWGDDDLLTARAHAPELEQMSGRILRKLDDAGDAGAVTRATTRNRMAWLSAFYREPIRTRGAIIARRVALAGAVVAVAAVTAVGIARAVDYHPTYVERIEQQQQDLQGTPHEQAE